MDIGIDLGTTYSAVARLNPKGEAEILENREGERLTPSAVYFQENGEVIIGHAARQIAQLYPDRVITHVKDYMGTDHTYEIDGRTYRPQDVSALILKKLVQDAEARTGEKAARAVIAIPAYYNDVQRSATMEAAQLAGLRERQIVIEPTAAAVAFAHSGRLGQGRLLVYDLGGGTFDVSIIQQVDAKVKVLATGGYSELGGHFFDAAIRNHLSDLLLDEDPPVDLEGDPAMVGVYQDLALKAEEAKKLLSSVASTDIILNIAGAPRKFTLTREDYETMILPFCQQTEATVRRVMEKAGVSFADLDQVLLVGGSSRTPLIQRHLERLSGKAPSRAVNPDEAVALGAALCAGSLRYIQDVCSRGVGLVSYDYAMDRELFVPVIPNNAILPAKGARSFGTASGTDHLVVKIAEADDAGGERWTLLRAYDIRLPETVPPLTKITLSMELDERQILHMLVECASPVSFRQELRLDRTPDPEEQERRARAALIADTTVL